MSKDKGYWVKVLDEEKANILISLGFSCCSDVAIIKVAEDEGREGYVYLVNDNMIKLDKSYLRPLSYLDALNLDMEHNAKWRELCTDCLSNELMDKKDTLQKLFGEYNKEDKDKTDKPENMEKLFAFFREQSDCIRRLADELRNFEFEPVKEEVNLPDEIDLYNFFEKWGGKVVGLKEDKSYRRVCRAKFCVPLLANFCTRSLSVYLAHYGSFFSTEYYIGKKRYYAIKFKDKGVFLVSEKRYDELKEKKGEHV